jgi:hypothetical protein
MWPDTGIIHIGETAIARGYLMASAYIGVAAFSLLIPLAGGRRGWRGRVLAFVRTYYPQAFLSLFFTDSILLSAQAFGGRSHDAFFAAADQAIFGFQPAREFSRVLGSHAWINEIMYGAYFIYFALMVFAIWIPYIKGARAEGDRQIFTISAIVAVVFTWYVFFRVQGPKYWLPDLNAVWYDGSRAAFS